MTIVTAEQLKNEEMRLRYLDLLEQPDRYPSQANWQYIISQRMRGLGHALYRKYLDSYNTPDIDRIELHELCLKYFPEYLDTIPHDEAVEIVYENLASAPQASVELIHRANLFDARMILQLFKSGAQAIALDIIDAYSAEYSDAQLAAMRQLDRHINSLPETGYVEQRRTLLGSTTKYVCPNGHANPADAQYCSHQDCRLDKRGLTPEQNERIAAFRHRLRALEEIMRDF